MTNNNKVDYSNARCPIYFEDHKFGGHVASIEEFTNIYFDVVRTTVVNGKMYFCANDISKGLCINPSTARENANQAIKEVQLYLKKRYNTELLKIKKYKKMNNNLLESAGVFSSFSSNNNLLESAGVFSDYMFYNYMSDEELGIYNMFYDTHYYIDIPITHKVNSYSDETHTQMLPVLFVSEPVVHNMILKSRKKEAAEFRGWLSVEILPSIRLFGRDNAERLVKSETALLIDSIREMNERYGHLNRDMKTDFERLFKLISSDKASCNEQLSTLTDKVNTMINNNSISNAIMTVRMHDTNALCRNNLPFITNQVVDIATGLNEVFKGDKIS